jgi:hypothetical protein
MLGCVCVEGGTGTVKGTVVPHNLLLIKCCYILTCTMPQVTSAETDQVGTVLGNQLPYGILL